MYCSYISKRLPALCLTVMCLAGFFSSQHTVSSGSPVVDVLYYHFSHANVFHLAINLWALWRFLPRWSTCFISLLIASAVPLIPCVASTTPTLGLSAFLFAAYSRRYVAWRRYMSCWAFVQVLLIILVTGFLPHISWRFHLASLMLGYSVWYLIYRLRSK